MAESVAPATGCRCVEVVADEHQGSLEERLHEGRPAVQAAVDTAMAAAAQRRMGQHLHHARPHETLGHRDGLRLVTGQPIAARERESREGDEEQRQPDAAGRDAEGRE
jgi:hypothetical protein